MLLDQINGPDDLSGLSYEQLDELAEEIRRFTVHAVARTGGHLGSNLGAVELTLALHRVFDSPKDPILWDTGHQAYTHKIITGRRDGFDQLRQGGGLSGYPNRTESRHDWVENSHASTILSYAHGLSTAFAARGDDHRTVVAVIGDGSMTGGMAYEALNNIGHAGTRCVIVVNDNGRSYAPTIGKLSESLHRLRLSPTYVKRRNQIERLLSEMPLVGGQLERGAESMRAALRELFESTAFYEQLGVRYTGPIDGHDLPALEAALRDAATYDGPIVVHVITQKGRGYDPAEQDDEKRWHDTGAFDVETGPVGAQPSGYTGVFSRTLIDLADHDERIVALTGAMPGSTGLIPFAERFPDRFLDVGIAEQHAVTAAAGMAMGGLRPVVAIYSTFLSRAFDQVNLDVGLHGLPVVFVLDRAGITGDDGPSHHGVLDLVLLTKVPGLTMLCPSSTAELAQMLRDAMTIETGPVAIRFPKGAVRSADPDDHGNGLEARRLRSGSGRVCLLAVGKMVEAALRAADELSTAGVEPTVWDVRCASPLDPAMLADAAEHDLVVTIEDGIRQGGVGSLIMAAMADAAPGTPIPRVRVLGTPLAYLDHGKVADIHHQLGLDGPGIAETVRVLLTAHASA
ncbi:MAG TPA: 1-deoxy-D-xylulose-5-phosphate synthase [Acidimicrobiales bacterium]